MADFFGSRLSFGFLAIENIDNSLAEFLMFVQEPLQLGARDGQSAFVFCCRPIVCKLFRVIVELLPIRFRQGGGFTIQLFSQAGNNLVEFSVAFSIELLQLVISRAVAHDVFTVIHAFAPAPNGMSAEAGFALRNLL